VHKRFEVKEYLVKAKLRFGLKLEVTHLPIKVRVTVRARVRFNPDVLSDVLADEAPLWYRVSAAHAPQLYIYIYVPLAQRHPRRHIQDILSLVFVCARINHPFITPADLHYKHYCNTIARRLRHI